MFGIIYILLAFGIGKEIAGFLLDTEKSKGKVKNPVWLFLSVSFAAGILVLTWSLYIAAWFLKICGHCREPLFYANILVMLLGGIGILILYFQRMKCQGKTGTAVKFIGDKELFVKESCLYGVLFVFIMYMMFYVFYIRDGILYSGFTVYGDYAPHTAMMRSFSAGNNFPTQYPHFGGEDVKYHFMFQFLVGNLEFLGMRLDIAYNLVSTFSLLGFLMILGQLAQRIGGSFAGSVWTMVLFFFRSGITFFRFVWEHLQTGDLWTALCTNTEFLGYTANENWGLWNFNVYLNQRHLAFGLLIISMAIWIFMDWLEVGVKQKEKGICWIRQRIFSETAWKSIRIEKALLLGLLIGLCSFWNGAAVIGGLLILLGFSVFSDGKLDYGIMAFVAVVISFLQSRIFIRGEAMKPAFYWGFLAENKNPVGVLWYLVQISGFFVIGLWVLAYRMERRQRTILLSFLFPLFFAFFVSLTPDINVNHKYIMISWAFLTIFWGSILSGLWKGKIAGKLVAALLVITLTGTGIYDFVIILKNNGPGRRVAVDLESDVTKWLEKDMSSEDLILTPEYSMSEVTMAGVMLYCGWPYYAWSAGYDTNYRAAVATEMYTTTDSLRLAELAKKEGITHILYEEGMTFEEKECREDTIAKTFPLVYKSKDGRIKIYETGLSVHHHAGI